MVNSVTKFKRKLVEILENARLHLTSLEEGLVNNMVTGMGIKIVLLLGKKILKLLQFELVNYNSHK